MIESIEEVQKSRLNHDSRLEKILIKTDSIKNLTLPDVRYVKGVFKPMASYVVSIIMLRVLCCDYLIHIVQEKIFMIHVILFIPSDSYNSIFIS